MEGQDGLHGGAILVQALQEAVQGRARRSSVRCSGSVKRRAAEFLQNEPVTDAEPDQVLRAMRVVAAGGPLLLPTVTRRVIDQFAGPAAAPLPHPVLGIDTVRCWCGVGFHAHPMNCPPVEPAGSHENNRINQTIAYAQAPQPPADLRGGPGAWGQRPQNTTHQPTHSMKPRNHRLQEVDTFRPAWLSPVACGCCGGGWLPLRCARFIG
jgi:hypothetical protein